LLLLKECTKHFENNPSSVIVGASVTTVSSAITMETGGGEGFPML
jgi:hypothetical protein